MDFLRHGSGVQWPPKTDGPKPSIRLEATCAIGAPSARISLVRLRPRRAGLRFSRQNDDTTNQLEVSINIGHRSHALKNPNAQGPQSFKVSIGVSAPAGYDESKKALGRQGEQVEMSKKEALKIAAGRWWRWCGAAPVCARRRGSSGSAITPLSFGWRERGAGAWTGWTGRSGGADRGCRPTRPLPSRRSWC